MNNAPSPASDLKKENRGSFRRAGLIVAGVVILLAVVSTIAVLNGSGGDASPSRKRTASDGGCHSAAAGQQIPRAAPSGITWTVVKSVAVPVSSTAGPLVVDGDVARCFARTPTGALIAAWQIDARHLLSDDWRRVTDQQVQPGSGRDAYEKRRAAITGDTTDPGAYGQLAGFQFVTYSPATAVLQFVTRFGDGTMQASALTVTWSGGDWRLQLQPDGGDSPNAQTIQSLDGFVPWGGV